MAREIDISNDQSGMTYSGEKPFRGLGFQIDAYGREVCDITEQDRTSAEAKRVRRNKRKFR